MPKTKLHLLDQSGATDGQVPTWDQSAMGGDGEWVPADGPASAPPLGWYNVKDYGAIGDGTTDDTGAIDAAINAINAAGRGVLYLPASQYKVTSALTPLTVSATVRGDGSSDAYGIATGKYVSAVVCTSATANCMEIGQSGSMVRDLAFVNSNGSETAGAALYVTGGEHNQYSNLVIYGFYDNMYVHHGGTWTAEKCFFTKPVRYSLHIDYPGSPDGGDQHLIGCDFYAKDRNATAAIYLASGGGLKLDNCKINTNSGSGYYAYGVDLDIPSGVVTSVLLISSTSIENIATTGVRVKANGSANYDMIAIGGGSEIAFYTSGSGPAIDLNCDTVGNIRAVMLGGLAMRANPTRAVPAISLTNVNNAVIGDRVIEGFSSAYASSGGSGIVDGMGGGVPTSRLVSAGTGLSGGGDLSADRTLSIDTTAETERIQDTVGAMVVPGSGMTATYDDTLGTLTLASTGGGGTRYVPMTTTIGGGDPQLVFTENGELLMVEVNS